MRILGYLILLLIFISCKEKNSPLEKEISNLNPAEVISYWEYLFQMDQTFRGLESVDSIDNINFKKMVLMIKHHGYPTKTEHSEKANVTPNIIFTHQSSPYVCEKYFPILHEAFLQEKADTFWFLHNVKGLSRGKYTRDIIRGRDLNPDDIPTILNQLKMPLEPKPNFDLSNFDQLHQKFIEEVQQIQSGKRLGEWINDKNDFYSIFDFNDELFIQKMYRDSSYGFPQKVKYFPKEKKYLYIDDLGFADKFSIDSISNLKVTVEYQKGDIRTVIYKNVKNSIQ